MIKIVSPISLFLSPSQASPARQGRSRLNMLHHVLLRQPHKCPLFLAMLSTVTDEADNFRNLPLAARVMSSILSGIKH